MPWETSYMATPKRHTTPSGASFYLRKMRTEQSFWLPIYHAQNVLDVGRQGTTFPLHGADTIAQAKAELDSHRSLMGRLDNEVGQ